MDGKPYSAVDALAGMQLAAATGALCVALDNLEVARQAFQLAGLHATKEQLDGPMAKLDHTKNAALSVLSDEMSDARRAVREEQ